MSPRAYESPLRAASADATRERIVRTTIDLAFERRDIEMTLDEIATRAGTTVKTVLRHFGTRDALIAAGIQVASAEVAAERKAPRGDADASIRLLIAHYERWGAFVLTILASAQPGAQQVAESGRRVHRAWVETAFEDRLPKPGAARDALVDQLVVVTDVYAWKLLRLDRGLDAATTTARVHSMTRALLVTPT